MRSILTTLLAVFGLCSMAVAQRSKGIEFGVGIGFNGSNILSEYNDRAKINRALLLQFRLINIFQTDGASKLRAFTTRKGQTAVKYTMGI